MTASGRGRRGLARILPWIGSAVVLVGAWFVVADTPTAAEKRPTFDVAVAPGRWGVGRNITARALEMTLSDQVENGPWQAQGNWLVVEVEAATVVDGGTLNLAQFSIGGVVYNATDRTAPTMRGTRLFVGIPQTGRLAFDLPDDLALGVGELRLGLDSNTELDSVVVVAIDLVELPRVPTMSLDPPAFGAP